MEPLRSRESIAADSISVDPHKWLFQPYEAGCILVRDVGALERAFSIQHDVLQDSVWGAKHANLADYGIQLSRSFRALKIWMSIQAFGLAAFRAAIENGLDLASRAADYASHLRAAPWSWCRSRLAWYASASTPAASAKMPWPA